VKTFVRRLGLGIVFGAIALAAVPASAQEITLGYQFQTLSFDIDDVDDGFIDDSVSAPLGFNIDVAGPITPTLDIVGQFDWSRKSEGFDLFGEDFSTTWNFTTFGGGVRWSSRGNPSVTPFVQGLFGVTRTSFGCEAGGLDCDDIIADEDLSSTDPMFQIGGGVVIPVGGWNAVGQIDYRRIFMEGAGTNSIRFVLGVRLSLQ
jgi:hypothetical protein